MSVFSDGFSDLHGRVGQFPKRPCPLVENHWLRGFINLQTSGPQSSIFQFTSPHSMCFWQLTPKSRPFWDTSQRHLFCFLVSFHPVWRVGDEEGDRAASSLLETEDSACGWPGHLMLQFTRVTKRATTRTNCNYNLPAITTLCLSQRSGSGSEVCLVKASQILPS